ncbi:MAG: 30S ribosomal protein S6 [Candidatus Microgenomates bacterium]|jgi:small subunit ribosomal protein S6
MEKYELTVVLDGKVTAAKKKSILATLEKIITVLEGKIVKIDDWGVKDLAYQIEKSLTGSYCYLLVELKPTAIKALNLKLKMEPEILRHLIVKI